MVAVTSEEQVAVVRREFDLLIAVDGWGSNEALDRILTKVSKLPHTASREKLENDILDLRLSRERVDA
jgi:hypothetical protein